jgi:hypothetical protein
MRARPKLRAVCLVGACEWEATHDLSTVLDRQANRHRAQRHPWVKPGRVHRILQDDPDPDPDPAAPAAQARKPRQRRPIRPLAA